MNIRCHPTQTATKEPRITSVILPDFTPDPAQTVIFEPATNAEETFADVKEAETGATVELSAFPPETPEEKDGLVLRASMVPVSQKIKI